MLKGEFLATTKPRVNLFTLFLAISLSTFIIMSCELAPKKGWLTYRHDITLSGVTDEHLSVPLSLRWVFKPDHAPKPAWYEPSEEIPRSHFDNAYYTTVAGGKVYFGSSVDNKVYAISAKTGKVKWTFFTEGPVRCAPTFWNNRVYVGSDDGHRYKFLHRGKRQQKNKRHHCQPVRLSSPARVKSCCHFR